MMVNHELKNIKFYLDSVIEVHIYYDRLLFSINDTKSLPPIYIANYIELKVLKKNIIPFDMLINSKSKVVNFCNLLHAPELRYNFLIVDIIKKARYSIIAKNGKMIVDDNKNSVIILEVIRISTSCLVNVSASKKTLFLTFLHLVSHSNVSWTL